MILSAAAEEGGTLVSDGAKLSSRKRGMLNSALVTRKGVIFLQMTDGTGKTKDGEFLRDDYSAAIEKAGPISTVCQLCSHLPGCQLYVPYAHASLMPHAAPCYVR